MSQLFREYVNYISPLQEVSFGHLSKLLKPLVIKKNDFFIKEGAYARRIGFLEEGVVRAFFTNNEGKEYNKQFFVAPSIIGAYTSLLTKQKNQIAQQALTDCKVLVANYEEVENLFTQFHDIERLGRKVAEFYFLEKEKKEIEMALLDGEQRYLILRETFPTIESIVSQKHIASYLGITPTQLSRVRRKMMEG